MKLKNFLKPKNETIRDKTVKSLFSMIEKYSKWYEDQGLLLPPDYATDPSGWTEELHKINKAFKLLIEDINGKGAYYDAKHKWDSVGERDIEKIEEIEKEIKEGLSVFGKQLLYLTDTPNYEK